MTDDDCHHDESPMVLRHRRRWRGRLVIGVICGVVAMLATSTGLYLPVVRQLAWRKHVHIINHDRTVEDGGAVWIIETSTMRVLTTVTAYAYPSASLAARHREQSRTVLEGGETRIDAKNRARRVTWEWREEAFVPAWFTVHGHHPSPYWHEYPGGMYLIDSSAVGWPLRAFRWEETFGVVGNAVLTDDESSEFGFRGMLGLTQQVGVPALPIWPGLLLNTLFYGAIWFALFTALAALRTARRLRRGLCPLCRYDLRGLPQRACPECGWGRTPPAPQAAVPTLQPEGLRRQ